jgi:Domain of unknown function (DUF4265)
VSQSLADQGFVKIRMSDPSGDLIETLWAMTVGPGRFKLDNVPWFAYGLSLGDIVEGVEYAPAMYDFTRVAEPSGNRAIRVMLDEGRGTNSDAGKVLLAGLTDLGCGYEGATRRLVGVTIPPSVNLADVADYLVSTGVTWEYASPTYDDLFGQSS